jgi:hypothetical protein
MVAASGAVSCGASIRALYESDVRFEHCMALDAVADVKPTIRRACWEEWVSFYPFGQTRDRIDYARQRKQELGAASDFDEGDEARRRALASASPYPTNASAPPPSTLATPDGGAALASTAATDDVSKGRREQRPRGLRVRVRAGPGELSHRLQEDAAVRASMRRT